MRCKPLLLLVLCTMTAFLFTACGGRGAVSSNASSPAPSPAPPTSGAQPGGSGNSGGSGSGGSAGSGSSGSSGGGSGSQSAPGEKKFSLPATGNMIAVDLNRDGRTDLLIYGSSLIVLLNNGNGDFGGAITIPTPGNASLTGLALADFNGDGWPDVVGCLASPFGSPGSAAVYLNDHSGKMVLSQTISLPAQCTGIAAGDANRDGKADIAATYFTLSSTTDPNATPSNAIVTWFGDGAGHFANPTTQSNVTVAASGDTSRNPCRLKGSAGADFNSDGTLDLLLFGDCNGYPATYGNIYLGIGDGTGHYVLKEVAEGNTSITGSPYVKDINGDGKPDVVYLSSNDGPHGSSVTDLNYAISTGAGSVNLILAASENAYAGEGSWLQAGSPLNGANTALEGFSSVSCCSTPSTYGVKIFNQVGESPSQTIIYGQSTDGSAPGTVTGIASADFDNNATQDFAVVEANSNNVATLHVYLR